MRLACPAIIMRRSLLTGAAAVAAYAVLERPAAASGWMLIAHQSAGGQNSPATTAINCTGADLIVIVWAGAGGTLQDSSGNTWTTSASLQNTNIGGQSWNHQISYVQAPTVTSSQTFTINGSGVFGSLCVAAFSGSTSSPLEQTNKAVGSSSPEASGSITPGQNNELVVTGLGAKETGGSATTYAVSGYTVTDTKTMQSTYFGTGLGYVAQTSAAATNPSWTDNGTGIQNLSAIVASFKAPASTGSAVRATFFHPAVP